MRKLRKVNNSNNISNNNNETSITSPDYLRVLIDTIDALNIKSNAATSDLDILSFELKFKIADYLCLEDFESMSMASLNFGIPDSRLWTIALERDFPIEYKNLEKVEFNFSKAILAREAYLAAFKKRYGKLTNNCQKLFILISRGKLEELQSFISLNTGKNFRNNQTSNEDKSNDFLVNDSYGYNPINWASYQKKQNILDYFYECIVKTFFSETIENNSSQLKWACMCGQLAAVKALLLEKDVLHKQTKDYPHLLRLAAKYGHRNIVEYLLEAGTRVDAIDKKDETALHLAAQYGHSDVVACLCAYKADINTINKSGETALHLAIKNNHLPIFIALSEKTTSLSKTDMICLAAGYGHLSIVQYLYETLDVQINETNENGNVPIRIAALNNHLDIVAYLYEKKVKIDQIDSIFGDTPFHAAVRNNCLDVVTYLLHENAKIDQENREGDTPLFIVSSKGYHAIVKSLLTAGADVNKTNAVGATPLLTAAQNGYVSVVACLLAAGANVNQASNDGSTPFSTAQNRGHLKICALLKLCDPTRTLYNRIKEYLKTHTSSNVEENSFKLFTQKQKAKKTSLKLLKSSEDKQTVETVLKAYQKTHPKKISLEVIELMLSVLFPRTESTIRMTMTP